MKNRIILILLIICTLIFIFCTITCTNSVCPYDDKNSNTNDTKVIPSELTEVTEKDGSSHSTLPIETVDLQSLIKKTDSTISVPSDVILEMIKVNVNDSIILGEDYEDVTKKVSVTPYKMSKYEISYNLWYLVYSWATNKSRKDKQYTFENLGSEGAYAASNTLYPYNEGNEPSTSGLPVNRLNWRDCIVWCNAFSELTGLTPVYYSDEDFSAPIRNSIYEGGSYDSSCPLDQGEAHAIDINSLVKGQIDNPYVNKSANGWRLPYDSEWEYAARKCADGSFISGANAPGDVSAPCTGNTSPTLIQQIQGIEPTAASKVVGNYAWHMGNSKKTGPTTTAAGWDDSTTPYTNYATRMHKQGGKLPTELGFYDLGGNSYEWSFDFVAPYDWEYDVYTARSLRSATFQWSSAYLQSSYRYYCPPQVRMGGLRLAQNY